ncbi:MAG TPA: CvpA family protein [Candidatus Limnocylindria bacterium]|nr:CvpA family protein [Candidatus Limnocylindria bacterium]
MADVAIIVLLFAFLLVGFFRGALRQLLALGAWLVAFVVAAQARIFLADWLMGQEPDFSLQYANMLSFLVGFLVLFMAALAIIELSGRTITLSNRAIVEEVVGGAALLLVGVLAVTGVIYALSTYYVAPTQFTADVDLVRQLNTALDGSKIAGVLRDTLVPLVQSLLGPLLPPDVRSFG